MSDLSTSDKARIDLIGTALEAVGAVNADDDTSNRIDDKIDEQALTLVIALRTEHDSMSLESTTKARVVLFKDSGKYYTEEEWQIPPHAIGPYDMLNSPDFHRIGGGVVLVVTQEPWGYPHLI